MPNENQWKRLFRNLDTINESRHVTCKDEVVKDQRNSSYDSPSNIYQEVTKIRILIREHNYLYNITELRQHTNIASKIVLSSDLVNYTNIAFNNLKENLPKILRNDLYKIKIVYSTHEEQTNSEKI